VATGLSRFLAQNHLSARSRTASCRVEAVSKRQNRDSQFERGRFHRRFVSLGINRTILAHAGDDRREKHDAPTDQHFRRGVSTEGPEPVQDRVLGAGPSGPLRDVVPGVVVALQRGRQTGAVSIAELLGVAAAAGECGRVEIRLEGPTIFV
jgi:hypothetical protein